MRDEQKVKLLAVGDISLISRNSSKLFNDDVIDLFNTKDILFGNLETVLSEADYRAEKAVVLNAHSDNMAHLVDAGFNALNIANNHTFDLGFEGFNQTCNILEKNNVEVVGLGEKFKKGSFTFVETNNIKCGFLGYSETNVCIDGKIITQPIEENLILGQISYFKRLCDHLIVSMHWGTENVFYPAPEQVNLAYSIINAGASIVLGHHSHVFQPIERFRNGIIVYSLGNFQFKASGKIGTKNSAVVYFLLSKQSIDSFELLPTYIKDDYSVSLMKNSERRRFINELNSVTRVFEKNKFNKLFWYEQIAFEYLSGNFEAWILRIRKYGLLHFVQCLKWLISPFVIKCYLALLRNLLKKL